jgi:hypothetical protein
MAFYEDTGTWRDLATGVDPNWGDPENADGALDAAGTPPEPIYTRLEGPWGIPWWDGIEDPTSPTGLPFPESPNPSYPNESVGAAPLPGAYEPAFRTHGPIMQWGHEPSGGLYGDQAIGRIQRFPANIPDRYDPNGIWNIDYRDELAATIAANEQPLITDAETTTNLIQWPNVGSY